LVLDILHRVTLLGVLKKKPEESLDDVMEILIDTGMYEKAEAQKVFADLRASGYIVGEGLSFIGVDAAQKAEQEFKQ
jgi:tRNA splicing endonuclease